MFMHLSPKERFGYVALAAVFLAGAGFVAAQKLHRPAVIELHETTQPQVSFDHGSPVEKTRSSTPRESGSPSEIVVDVAGAVNNPGLISLPSGARLYDAIRVAGGPTDDANLDAVNLAAKAADGIQVFVPHKGFQPGMGSAQPMAPNSAQRSSRGKQPSGVVNINSADVTQFITLPGIGPSMAQRIIDYRTEHGTFRAVDDLEAVPGFGKRKLDPIRQWITAE